MNVHLKNVHPYQGLIFFNFNYKSFPVKNTIKREWKTVKYTLCTGLFKLKI